MAEDLGMVGHWQDVSVTISADIVHWPGDVPVQVHKTSDMNKGDMANVSAINMSVHTGTHIDAPAHFIANGYDISQVPLEHLTGETLVLDIKNHEAVTAQELMFHHIVSGDRILFKTANSETDWTNQPFNENYVYLDSTAAIYLRNKGVVCVGIDYLSIARYDDGETVHRILLEKGITVIEGLNLSNVEPGRYEMVCLPLKIQGADGAPARVLLRKLMY